MTWAIAVTMASNLHKNHVRCLFWALSGLGRRSFQWTNCCG